MKRGLPVKERGSSMRFYTIQNEAGYVPAVSADGGKSIYYLKDLGMDVQDLAELIRKDAFVHLNSIRDALRTADPSRAADPAGLKICAPIMYPDQDMICLGINYHAHAEEAAGFSKEAFGGERPYTIYFSKRVSRATGTGDAIPSYEGLVDGLDYESELGVVLAQDVKGVSAEEAMKCIFGCTVINDVSARNLQTRHKQWYMGKSLDGFAPMGPCIVTLDELGDPENLEISSTVNGELRQCSNTKLMIQTIGGAISELSQGMTLKAGTIIATGTPAGVGMGFNPPRFLKKGDAVTCRIEGIGELVNYVE